MTMDDFCREDPLTRAALAANGVDVDDLPWEPCENAAGEEINCAGYDGTGKLRPSVHVHSGGGISIRWYSPRHMMAYVVEADGYRIFTVERYTMPETMLSIAEGRLLSEIVEMPGAERYRVTTAVNSNAFPSDPLDLRMAIELV